MEFLDFAARNWYLFLALFVILGLLIGGEIVQRMRGITAISPSQALQFINNQDAVVVDLRDGNEYRNGHLPEARHIPHSELPQRINDLGKSKDRPIILYAALANQASNAATALKKADFNTVYTLKGGLAEWQNANLPVSKKK